MTDKKEKTFIAVASIIVFCNVLGFIGTLVGYFKNIRPDPIRVEYRCETANQRTYQVLYIEHPIKIECV